MGIFVRQDSPYYWMRVGRRLESTKIPHAGATAGLRKELRDKALTYYHAKATQQALVSVGLAEEERPALAFNKYAEWFSDHVIARRRGAARDLLGLARLSDFFETTPLVAIDRGLVQEYITKRLADRVGPAPKAGKDTRRTVSPSTVNREVDLLKGMLRDAVPKYLKASPLLGMKRLRTVAVEKRVLAAEEIARIIAELPAPRDTLFLLCVETLIRFGNAINLTRAENKGTYLALVDSKTGPYEVPLSERARQALAALPHRGQYYFVALRQAKNTRDWRAAMRTAMMRACGRAGIPYGRHVSGITFHTGTRATGATQMLRGGHDPKTVQSVGNWRDMRSMQMYLQTDMAHKRAAVDSIGASVDAYAHDAKEITAEARARARSRSGRRPAVAGVRRLE